MPSSWVADSWASRGDRPSYALPWWLGMAPGAQGPPVSPEVAEGALFQPACSHTSKALGPWGFGGQKTRCSPASGTRRPTLLSRGRALPLLFLWALAPSCRSLLPWLGGAFWSQPHLRLLGGSSPHLMPADCTGAELWDLCSPPALQPSLGAGRRRQVGQAPVPTSLL